MHHEQARGSAPCSTRQARRAGSPSAARPRSSRPAVSPFGCVCGLRCSLPWVQTPHKNPRSAVNCPESDVNSTALAVNFPASGENSAVSDVNSSASSENSLVSDVNFLVSDEKSCGSALCCTFSFPTSNQIRCNLGGFFPLSFVFFVSRSPSGRRETTTTGAPDCRTPRAPD